MNMASKPEGARRYRTIWVSDTHLGTRGCKAEFLLDFLRATESDTTRGVDTALFRPRPKAHFNGRPVFLFAGRVAVEKNIEAFLALDLPGTKVVIGDGPQLPALKARYPDTVFTGYKGGEELAEHIASADVFVFPTVYDPFGLVITEAMATGLPVITSAAAGAAELISPGTDGFVTAQPWDADAIAAHLAELRDSPSLRERVGAAARRRVEPLTWDRTAAETSRSTSPRGVYFTALTSRLPRI